MRFRHLPCCLALVALMSGCEPALAMLVTVENPAGATRLEVFTSLDGIAAREMPMVPIERAVAGTSFSFVLSLPGGAASRSLRVGVGARDGNGCLFARGFGQGM